MGKWVNTRTLKHFIGFQVMQMKGTDFKLECLFQNDLCWFYRHWLGLPQWLHDEKKRSCFKQWSHPFMRPKAFHLWSIGETWLSDEKFDLKIYMGVAANALQEPGLPWQEVKPGGSFCINVFVTLWFSASFLIFGLFHTLFSQNCFSNLFGSKGIRWPTHLYDPFSLSDETFYGTTRTRRLRTTCLYSLAT